MFGAFSTQVAADGIIGILSTNTLLDQCSAETSTLFREGSCKNSTGLCLRLSSPLLASPAYQSIQSVKHGRPNNAPSVDESCSEHQGTLNSAEKLEPPKSKIHTLARTKASSCRQRKYRRPRSASQRWLRQSLWWHWACSA